MVIRKKQPNRDTKHINVGPQEFGDYIERRPLTVQQFIDELTSQARPHDRIVMESDRLRPIFLVRSDERGHLVCILDGSLDDGSDE